jgi:formyltetrahydrofolate deformylase
MSKARFVLTLSCINRPGIVAAVSTYLFESGGDIREAQQFDDAETGKFFARIAFDIAPGGADAAALQAGLGAVAF